MTFKPTVAGNASAIQRLAERRRAAPTPAEREFERFLNELGNGALKGQFQREWACGGSRIVDFFFAEVRLAIEIDGGYHHEFDQFFLDLEREIEIEEFQVTFVRFTNEEIFGDREALTVKLRSAWRRAIRAMRLNRARRGKRSK
jgi:very-short-patch-repair endonuclease